jgi:hypothetical protein
MASFTHWSSIATPTNRFFSEAIPALRRPLFIIIVSTTLLTKANPQSSFQLQPKPAQEKGR